MKNKIVLMLAITFLTISSAYAKMPEDNDRFRKIQQMKTDLIEEMGLTEEQQAQLEEHKKRCQASGMELLIYLKDLRFKLREELNKYNSDMAEVDKLALEIKNVQSKILDQRIAAISTVKSMLNPDQYKVFVEKTSKFRERAMGPGGFGGGPPWARPGGFGRGGPPWSSPVDKE